MEKFLSIVYLTFFPFLNTKQQILTLCNRGRKASTFSKKRVHILPFLAARWYQGPWKYLFNYYKWGDCRNPFSPPLVDLANIFEHVFLSTVYNIDVGGEGEQVNCDVLVERIFFFAVAGWNSFYSFQLILPHFYIMFCTGHTFRTCILRVIVNMGGMDNIHICSNSTRYFSYLHTFYFIKKIEGVFSPLSTFSTFSDLPKYFCPRSLFIRQKANQTRVKSWTNERNFIINTKINNLLFGKVFNVFSVDMN